MATRTHMLSLHNNILVLVFLLLARTGCDWVEISQNHYRNEPPRQDTLDIHHEETTEAIIVYRNNSLLDKHWKKGVIDRVPSVANIRRVHVPGQRTSPKIEKNIFTKQASIHINTPDESYVSVVSEPNTLSKYHEGKIPTTKSDLENSDKITVSNSNRGNAFERNSEAISFYKDHSASTNIFSRIESVTSIYLRASENEGIISTQRTPQTKYPEENKVKFNYEDQTGIIIKPFIPKDSKSEDFSYILQPIDQSLPINNPMAEKTTSFVKRTKTDSGGKTSKANSTHIKNQFESDKNKESIEHESNQGPKIMTSKAMSNNTKGSTINTMWNLIKVVRDAIYKSARKSFRSKVNYLEGLKSNILSSIEDQVERTWPEEDARSSRRVREAAGRGHIEFPSSESALMSISFLTFAVFLIKLVLQVIHTYKNKTMMVTPALVTAVGRAAAAIKSN